MKRTAQDVTLALLLGLSWEACSVHAAEPTDRLPESSTSSVSQTVAFFAAPAQRDSRGRIASFADARGRQFIVEYGDSGHVSSVNAAEGPNRLDLPRISYSAEGTLVRVSLGDGNELIFSYDDNGVQYVQDRYGALIRRNRTADGYVTFSEEDPSARLRATVERLDALLKALAASR